MRTTDVNETDLVLAAQAGDRQAVDELVAAGLPLVYTIVRRALDGHADIDDVVQDTMLRAVRQLPALHQPESFRAWLAAIAVHQVSTHLHRRGTAARRMAPLEEAAEVPDAAAEVEDVTGLRLELSGQRRQVRRAAHWLDPADRALLPLWWLEIAGVLSRTELAGALGVSVAHAAVRVQRMRHQLDLSREIVAALDATPRCPDLDALVDGWDGTPGPLWRKRLARHVRPCPVCAPAAEGLISADRLLPGFALLPVPAALSSGLIGKATLGATVKAGVFGHLAQILAAHPVAATVAVAVAAGAAVTVTALPADPPPSQGLQPAVTTAVRVPSAAPPAATAGPASRPPATTAATGSPSARTATLAPGRTVSIESAHEPGLFVTTVDGLGVLAAVPADGDAAQRRRATFTVLAGLADPACFTFRADDGRFLRHASWRFQLSRDEGTPLFRGDATFCTRAGAAAGTVVLDAQIYPGWFLHHRGEQLWVDQDDGTAAFRAECSFRIRPALQ